MECTTEPETTIQDLPNDVLLLILSQLDPKSTSPVCKLFCSLSSSLVRLLTLTQTNPSLTYLDFRRLFKRFPCVKKIRIHCSKVETALLAVSNSDLNLEKMNLRWPDYFTMRAEFPLRQTRVNMATSKVFTSIKFLKMSLLCRPAKWECDDRSVNLQPLIEFINMFPSLTGLNLTDWYPCNDDGIHKITLTLPNLRKIKLSFRRGLTDRTLGVLSSNCSKLESVSFKGKIQTPEALYKFFSNNPQLSSVHMSLSRSPPTSKIVECMQTVKHLNHLSLGSHIINDTLLVALVELRPPLKSLRLFSSSPDYTMAGLTKLLSACPGLEKLMISLPIHEDEDRLSYDADMSMIVKGLPCLKYIRVWSHHDILPATLSSLVQNCPLVETICLAGRPPIEELMYNLAMPTPTKKNYSIRSILSPFLLDISSLRALELCCPNLWKKKHYWYR